jgi:hypothetical protein
VLVDCCGSALRKTEGRNADYIGQDYIEVAMDPCFIRLPRPASLGNQVISRSGSAEVIDLWHEIKFVVLGDDCEAAPMENWPWEKDPGHDYDWTKEDDDSDDGLCWH